MPVLGRSGGGRLWRSRPIWRLGLVSEQWGVKGERPATDEETGGGKKKGTLKLLKPSWEPQARRAFFLAMVACVGAVLACPAQLKETGRTENFQKRRTLNSVPEVVTGIAVPRYAYFPSRWWLGYVLVSTNNCVVAAPPRPAQVPREMETGEFRVHCCLGCFKHHTRALRRPIFRYAGTAVDEFFSFVRQFSSVRPV